MAKIIFAPHATDFYKTGHAPQYPEGTTLVMANFTARALTHARKYPGYDGKVVVFGQQGFVQSHLIEDWNNTFFNKPKQQVIDKFKRRMDTALGEGCVDPRRMADLHDLGHLPLLIKSLPEGSRVPMRVPFMTMQNTHSEFAWCTNYIESPLSAEIWQPMTAATITYGYRQILAKWAEKTGSNPAFTNWQIHDFSMRGLSNVEAAACSVGPAHLLSSYGTDSIAALDYLEDRYGANADSEIVGGSIPATEHSVMCMGGKANEEETYRRLIQDVYPSGNVAIVSDTWNLFNVVTNIIPNLKDVILNRKPNALGQARVVLRPDSGIPIDIICGDKNAPEGSPECKGVLECLWETFGGMLNASGFRVLDSHIGVIYGEAISLERYDEILERLHDMGFASENIVVGVGSYGYQFVTRDTYGMAVKATFGVIDGVDQNLIKDPATDDGTKKSAEGLLRVEEEGGTFVLYERQTWEQECQGALQVIFKDSKTYNFQTLAQIRARLGAIK